MTKKRKQHFLSENSQLMSEWDWVKNSIPPSDVSVGSAHICWWLCSSCQHSWSTPAHTRGTRGSGCPECAKKKRGIARKRAAASKNGLAVHFPDIAKEWHPTKNNEIPLEIISSHSNIKVWWLCAKCGYEWQTSVNHRTSQGNSCPYCANANRGAKRTKAAAQKNNFATQYPELVAEWNYDLNGDLSPDFVSARCNKKVWWRCSFCGHEWQATINHRTSRSDGCPSCTKGQSSFLEQLIFFYVTQAFPDAINRYKGMFEFDIFIPSINTAIEYDGAFYHKSAEKLRKDNLKDRYCQENGIRLIRFRAPSLSDTESAYRITCQEHQITNGLVTLFDFLSCPCPSIDVDRDHIQITNLFRQTQIERSVQSLSPDIAAEWHPHKNGHILPSVVPAFSNLKYWWQCKTCGYEWQDSPSHRNGRGSGCPFCAGRVVISGKNDFATLHPLIAQEWHPEKNRSLLPSQVSRCSNKRVWWKCAMNHEWVARINDRVSDNTQCPFCQNRKVWVGFNDLDSTHPEIAQEWHRDKNAILPTEVTAGSSKKVWWKCAHGHEWQAVIYSRKTRGCPFCAGKHKV